MGLQERPAAPWECRGGMSRSDERWMMRAVELARRGEGGTRPNPPVGAVVVHGHRIAGEGYHRKAGEPHAEVLALAQAGARARGAVLYVTLEPCSTWGRTPPCTEAILRAGVRRVVAAVADPNPRHRGRGFAILRRNGLEVKTGVCHAAAAELIAPFALWVTQRRPFVTVKLGVTMDGRIADRTGHSRWITSPAARRVVQALRRQCDAVLVGQRTAVLDDPSLLGGGRRPRAFRVVVDTGGALDPDARVFTDGHVHRTIIATTNCCPSGRQAAYQATGATVWTIPHGRGGVSLRALMRKLHELGVLHVLCEGGGELVASLIRAGLVDRYMWFVAPRVLGATGCPAVGGPGWLLETAPRLRFVRCERVGSDMMLVAVPKKKSGRDGRS